MTDLAQRLEMVDADICQSNWIVIHNSAKHYASKLTVGD